jgi:hypothetical protein
MSFKSTFFALIFLVTISTVSAQVINLEENKPVVQNGIEYGFTIRNEQVKSAKGEDYSRFEVTFYATNTSGCTRLYASRQSLNSDDNANLIATYFCSNANGKRLTAKGGTVKARDFLVNAKISEGGKEIIQSVKAGYIFRNGETLKNNVIVLVPKGERPVISCTPNYLPELQ